MPKEKGTPRIPTPSEKAELAYWAADEMGGWEANDHLEQASRLVEQASIAVFDSYITDSVGYAGKVMSVVWSGAPEMYEVFLWSGGHLVRVKQDKRLQQRE